MYSTFVNINKPSPAHSLPDGGIGVLFGRWELHSLLDGVVVARLLQQLLVTQRKEKGSDEEIGELDEQRSAAAARGSMQSGTRDCSAHGGAPVMERGPPAAVPVQPLPPRGWSPVWATGRLGAATPAATV